MKWVRTLAAPSVALLAVLLIAGCGGVRRLGASVEHDGELILEDGYGVSDSADASGRWRGLEGRPLKAVGKIVPEAGDPSVAQLRGKIRITVRTGDTSTTVEAVAMRLVRVPGNLERWKISADDVKRTARAAGL